VNEILAWIEYCSLKCLGRPDAFENSIVNHLLDNFERNFTFKQIDDKVQELWKIVDRNPGESPTDHRVLYRLGLKAFRGQNAAIKDERLQTIKARVQQLLQQDVPISARKGGRRLRSTSRVPPSHAAERVARRLFKQQKISGISPAKRAGPGRPPKKSISVRVGFPNLRFRCDTDLDLSDSSHPSS
jgi:hypothetical protein